MFRTDVVVNEQEIPASMASILQAPVSKSAKMKQLFDLGLDIKVIAEEMDVRYNFVYNVISNYVNINDVPVSKASGESKKGAIIGAFLSGKTNKEIAKELKLNYNYIYKVIREYGEQQAIVTRKRLEEDKVATDAVEGVVEPPVSVEAEAEASTPEEVVVPTAEIEEPVKVEEPVLPQPEPTEEVDEHKIAVPAAIGDENRVRTSVDQTYWKPAEHETKTGISTFLNKRDKKRS